MSAGIFPNFSSAFTSPCMSLNTITFITHLSCVSVALSRCSFLSLGSPSRRCCGGEAIPLLLVLSSRQQPNRNSRLHTLFNHLSIAISKCIRLLALHVHRTNHSSIGRQHRHNHFRKRISKRGQISLVTSHVTNNYRLL